ncbi:signal transduction histidine kinase [Okibacterium sp. HSC-33S16]|uniref:sensor histidine kinase n=1 Tax=Okibacterium sp. HSC-33S16 TaxID=2910965 RepID=UPI00209CE9B7|nr:sensor histidine kinase [Okibacterium sp. HSC-33S16]MCP2030632.1 signal transduction histidine kinase [Okibacterium sp. HSC-33S16]
MTINDTQSGPAPATAVISDTLDHMTGDERPAAAEPRPRNGYATLWAGVPRELGFLLLTLPIAVVGFSIGVTLFSAGASLVFIVVGLFVLTAALFVARAFGTLELVRLEAAGRTPISRPTWNPIPENAGFWRRTLGPLTQGHYWTYLLHTGFVNFVVSTFSWTLTITWLATALGGVTYWIWAPFLPQDPDQLWLGEVVFGFFAPNSELLVSPRAADIILMMTVGIVFLVTVPFITRGLTLLHDTIARGLLSRWQNDDLRTEVAALAASRGAAVSAEDQSVRRLERDIHDGPQQRLVRLQMDLAAAERRLGTDPESAKTLIAEARGQAQASLDELRALSRGFAPPILEDRGLVSAVESFAALSSIPITVASTLDAGTRLPAEIERNVYFVVAELITNASKHSGATAVRVEMSTPTDAAGSRRLEVLVADNGTGGARFDVGHGLSGLRDRLTGLRGSLTVDSPSGFGTRVTASVPGIDR